MPPRLDSYLLGYLHAHKSYSSFSCKKATFLSALRDELSMGTLDIRLSGQNTLRFNTAEQAELFAASLGKPEYTPSLPYLAGALDAKGAVRKEGATMRVRFSRVHGALAEHLHALTGKRGACFYGMNAGRVLRLLVPHLRLKRAKAEKILAETPAADPLTAERILFGGPVVDSLDDEAPEAHEAPASLTTIAAAFDGSSSIVYDGGDSFTLVFKDVGAALQDELKRLPHRGKQRGSDYHYVDREADRLLQLLIPLLRTKREDAELARRWWECAQVK